MSRAVFVDASAWIAIINKKHRHHQQAVEVYRRLLLEGTPLFTTTWTIYEALTLIKARVGYEAATKLWKVANNRRVVSMAKVGPKVEAQGLKIFFGYKDKTWGVVDCTSIALMRLLGCRQSFAFDKHFTEAGRQSGLEIIP